MEDAQALNVNGTVNKHAQCIGSGLPPQQLGFDPRPGHVAFVGDKVADGKVSSEYFGFPCQFSFHTILHTHLLSGAGTISQTVAGTSSGLSFQANPPTL
jgi:hypothetical protein